ncbi:MAG: hypothetical protein R2711_18860 [Acidimicrobiales bacterium]
MGMDLAPVEYVVIGYDGDAVDAGVAPSLRKLVRRGPSGSSTSC